MKTLIITFSQTGYTRKTAEYIRDGIASVTDDACDLLIDIAVDKDKTIRAICEDRFKDLEYGLKIVSRNTGATTFEINREMADNPDAELSKMVVESFKEAGNTTPDEQPEGDSTEKED